MLAVLGDKSYKTLLLDKIHYLALILTVFRVFSLLLAIGRGSKYFKTLIVG